ncbi:hypothetical protein ADK76_27550 [Streptomyces griseoflavus]|nr:hypothetical protein ADK76_27550 [Streptomyces griseoflavus]
MLQRWFAPPWHLDCPVHASSYCAPASRSRHELSLSLRIMNALAAPATGCAYHFWLCCPRQVCWRRAGQARSMHLPVALFTMAKDASFASMSSRHDWWCPGAESVTMKAPSSRDPFCTSSRRPLLSEVKPTHWNGELQAPSARASDVRGGAAVILRATQQVTRAAASRRRTAAGFLRWGSDRRHKWFLSDRFLIRVWCVAGPFLSVSRRWWAGFWRADDGQGECGAGDGG